MTYDFEDGAGPVPAHQHSNGGGWVADSARVAASAFVGPDAKVFGNASVYDNASVYGNASVSGNALVYGNASVYDNAKVYGNAWVFGTARVFGNAVVYGNARVSGNAWVCDNAWIYDNAWVYDNARVFGNAWVYNNAEVFGNAEVYGNAVVYGNASVFGNADVCGNAVVGMRLDRFDAAIKENTMSDGIAEIRAVAGRISDVDDHVTVHQAADEIERLRAELVEERHTVLEIVRSQDEFGDPHGLPWRVAPWGDGSSDTGNSNIISDRWQVVIASEMPTETAEFIVASVRFTTEAAPMAGVRGLRCTNERAGVQDMEPERVGSVPS